MSQSRIYVGHLDQRTRESDLEKFFKGFGRVREITMKTGFAFVEFDDYRDADDAVHDLNGKELNGSRVLVEFTRGMPRGAGGRLGDGDRRGGDRGSDRGSDRGGDRGGRRDFDRGDRGGRRDFRGGPPRSNSFNNRAPRGGGNHVTARSQHRVSVENLSSSVSCQDLKDFMRQAGEVVFTDVFPKRNEGVVEFASATDLRNALTKLDGKDLNGRKLRLTEEKGGSGGGRGRKRSRSRSGSRSRSRSRSRSKSRSRSASKSRSRSPKRSKNRSRSRSRSGSAARDDDRQTNDKKTEDKKRTESPNGNGENEDAKNSDGGRSPDDKSE